MSNINNNDEIKINFSISRSFISTQFAIILGAGALYLFSSNALMKKFILFAFILDGIGILFYFLTRDKEGAKDTDKDTEKEKPTPTESVEVDVKHSEKKSTQGVRNVDGTIKNRVNIPNSKTTHRTRRKAGVVTPVPEVLEEEKPEEITVENNTVNEDVEPVSLNEDVQTDWGGFF